MPGISRRRYHCQSVLQGSHPHLPARRQRFPIELEEPGSPHRPPLRGGARCPRHYQRSFRRPNQMNLSDLFR